MKEADRQRIERCLEEFNAWRASGLQLRIYVQQRGEDLADWRARLSWESRWRQMLNGTYVKAQRKTGVAFVSAVPCLAGATPKTQLKPVLPQPQGEGCLRIVVTAQGNGSLQASVEWSLSQLGASSAWLREVLA